MVIAPDVPRQLRATRRKLQLTMPVYSDSTLASAKALGIAFEQTDPRYHPVLAKHSGLDHHLLPVPSVFLLDADRRILFSYVNPQYRVRIPTPLVLDAARAFAAEPGQ